jgi:hypothetical protein
VVGGDFAAFGGDEEEGIVLFTFDFDIGFVAGLSIVNIAFMFQVEGMAVISSGLSIIKDGLIGARDFEYISEDESSFSCGYTERYMEGKDKTEGIERVTNIEDGRSFVGCGVS